MRGEHRQPASRTSRYSGSSPHARGALAVLAKHREEPGIIPACAGSTRGSPSTPRATWDHPRMRGEHKALSDEERARGGSSPHARGAREAHVAQEGPPGIIPACAGSTSQRHPLRHQTGDHPRMRGEHKVPFKVTVVDEGSSPHARGAHLAPHVHLGGQGIIPACAGSTWRAFGIRRRTRDHPRMRGEHRRPPPSCACRPGSSPHARGAPPTGER